jgi:ribonuclease J
VFLGGVAEIGRNMLVLEHEDDAIVIDCGVGFPEEDQFGIDLVLPNFSYLRERKEKVRGIFVTHGHEDHIGALPYLLSELEAPVYATKLTAGLIGGKLYEVRGQSNGQLAVFDPDEGVDLEAGVFSIRPFRVCHSIPDAVGFGISTPAGLIVHTGDFKFDETPIDNRLTDYETIRSLGGAGVRLLISDSTHIEGLGRTPSERVVGETYEQVFAKANGRIIIATFASLIARVQQVIDTAKLCGRSVVILGRSMESNVRISLELGYLSDPDGVIIDAKDAVEMPDERLVYLVTGSQGEPMAVLGRIANGDHRDVKVGPGDTVVISATPIPGNETAVFRIINRLFSYGADVIYSARALVHVSGHASREELAEMIDLVRPKSVIPWHGEHRHMALYRELAIEKGIAPEEIYLVSVGDCIEITPDRIRVTGHVPAAPVYVDGGTVGQIGEVVIRDRQALADDGILMIVVTIDRESGEIVAGPEVVTRGFVHAKESGELLDEVKEHIRSVLDGYAGNDQVEDSGYLSRQLRNATASFLYQKTRRRPMILPTVMEV